MRKLLAIGLSLINGCAVAVAAVPELSAWAPVSRSSQEIVVAGENLTSASGSAFKVFNSLDSRLATITEANQIEVIHDAMDTGPSIDWNSSGTSVGLTRVVGFESQLFRFAWSLEGAGYARVGVMRYSNNDGASGTRTFNRPEVWSILGADPARLYPGKTYTIIGRNMLSFTRSAGTNCSFWLRRTMTVSSVTNPNGSPYVVTTSAAHSLTTGDRVRLYGVTGHAATVNQTYVVTVTGSTTFTLNGTTGTGGAAGSGGQGAILYACVPITDRGGLNTVSYASVTGSICDVRIPSTVPAGDYKFVAFTNENTWGVSAGFDCTLLGASEESWFTVGGVTRGITNIQLDAGRDITSVSNPSGTPYVVTTLIPHNFRTGDVVALSGVSGHAGPSPNGQWAITVTGTTTFNLDATIGTGGAGGTGGNVRKSYRSGTDISHDLAAFLIALEGYATVDQPICVIIPPGNFFLSHTIVIPANMGICGAGKDATTLTVNPSLTGYSTSSWVAGAFATNLNVYDDNSGVYAGYGSGVNSGTFSGSQLVNNHPVLVRIAGSNARISELTLRAANDNWRRTAYHVIGAGNGIDDVQLDNVRMENWLAMTKDDAGSIVNPAGVIWFQNHRHWRFHRCDFVANRSFVAAVGVNNTQANNGVNQDILFDDCTFAASTPLNGGSVAGFVGTHFGFLNCHFDNLNRALASNGGHYPRESVIAHCHFANMGRDEGGAESVLFESRQGRYFSVGSATSTTCVVGGSVSFNMTGHQIVIVAGKGRGQVRRVTASSYSSPNNTLTIDSAWNVTPDTTSRVIVDAFPRDITICGNIWEHTKGGLNIYGGSSGFLIEQNTFYGSREGLLIDLQNGEAGEPDEFCWSGWTSIDSNMFRFTNSLRIQATRSASFASTYTFPMVFAVSYRKNEIGSGCTSAICTGVGTYATNASATATDLDAAPVVLCVGLRNNDWLTDDGRYNAAPVFARGVPDRPQIVYGRSVADLVVSGNMLDAVTISPQAKLTRSWASAQPPINATLIDVAKGTTGGGITTPIAR